MRCAPLLIAILGCLVATGCAQPDAAYGDDGGPAVDPKTTECEPAAKEFAEMLARGDSGGAYAMKASFTRQTMSAQEWQSSFQGYWEGFGKPGVVELTMEPIEDDPDWRTIRGIPANFPPASIRAEATAYLGHAEHDNKEGFFVSFVVVEEGGKFAMAGPYVED